MTNLNTIIYLKGANDKLPDTACPGELLFESYTGRMYVYTGNEFMPISSSPIENTVKEKHVRCGYCGTKIVDEHTHCVSCGAPV